MSLSEEIIEFISETKEYLDSADPIIISLKNQENLGRKEIDHLFRMFHSIKGVSGFLGFLNVQKITHGIEEILDKIRNDKVKISFEIVEILLEGSDFLRIILEKINQSGQDIVDDEHYVKLLQMIQKQLDSHNAKTVNIKLENGQFPCFSHDSFLNLFRQDFETLLNQVENGILTLLDGGSDTLSVIHKCEIDLATLMSNLSFIGNPDTFELINVLSDAIVQTRKKTSNYSDYLVDWFGALAWLRDFGVRSSFGDDVEEQRQGLIRDLRAKSGQLDEVVEKTVENVASLPTVSSGPQNRGEIRVEMEKMDRLVELIEELSVVTGVVSRESDISEDSKYLQAINKLKQITVALQDVAMSVRLVPLVTTVKKMTRLIFDVGRKLNKDVTFNSRGEKTELDRNMVEALQDPLVHIFRNAIDHGIEPPEERKLIGKDPKGNVQLESWLGGGEVFISIKDDGRGMDPRRIYNKAKEKGIISENMILSDKDALNLIFEPGFSTNDEVTDFSGRGVGMDVVKQSINRLGGSIEIESEVGKGSRFIISLPLISTIVETLLVRVGEICYSIRLSYVRELFSATSDQLIRSPDGIEHIQLRSHVYQIIRIGNIQKSKGRSAIENVEDGILILVENKGNFSVLLVDEILGTNQGVIKNLPTYMKSIQGISGCSVIGTNSDDISWTLDINYIMSSVMEDL